MASPLANTITALHHSFAGEVIDPRHPQYHLARKVWNGMIDRYPALILRPLHVGGVRTAIRVAQHHGMPLAVRGGGHGVAGTSTCDSGVLLDLSLLTGGTVYPRTRHADVPAGWTWGRLDQATQTHGLAAVGGMVSTTGVAGLTLGGGVGWLMRHYGLACDNMLAAQLVTASGTHVTASPTSHPDLFWALRGGGGNFGVVTHFSYQLHPVATVLGGFTMYPLNIAHRVLRRYEEYCHTSPDTVTTLAVLTTAPAQPFVPEHLHHQPVLLLAVCAIGPSAAEETTKLRALARPALDTIAPMPYIALQTMQDATAPHGLRNYWKSAYLPHLTEQLIGQLIDQAAQAPSPLSQIHIHQMGGAIARSPGGRTCVAHRKAPFMLNMVGMWEKPESDEINLSWLSGAWTQNHPLTAGAYSNFLDRDDSGRVSEAYDKKTWEKLRRIKENWDPYNFFQANHNIPPHQNDRSTESLIRNQTTQENEECPPEK